MMESATRFVLHDPLPTGRMAIEASAGTGKTYALSTLAARYVVERGVPVTALLIVTFTRAAAAELKDRVRARLVEFSSILAQDELTAEQVGDPLVSTLWGVDDDERELRRRRAEQAVTEFDAAMVTTIHGFAMQALRSLGSSVPIDPDGVLDSDSRDLVTRVVTDMAIGLALDDSDNDDPPDVKHLVDMAQAVMGNPGAKVVPDSSIVPIRSLVDEVCERTRRQRTLAGMMTYDDILLRLRDVLASPTASVLARSILRNRFEVVLIDEFQDTDPVQWEIFDSLFSASGAGIDDGDASGDQVDFLGDVPEFSVLVIVGDPKQAIYAFRGANVHTYLQAAHAPGTQQRDMDTNWRSDPAVLKAVEVLLDGVTFGDPKIGFHWVQPSPGNIERSMMTVGGENHPALAIRLLDGSGLPRTKQSFVPVGNNRFVYWDMARYLQNLFSAVEIPDTTGPRLVRPDDVAVLTLTNPEAQAIQRVLTSVGIPAVISRGESVLTSDAAEQWQIVLNAVARPGDPGLARAFALSWFGGRDMTWVATADDQDLGAIQEQLRDWGDLLTRRGAAVFIGQVRVDTRMVSRVLSGVDGDRSMTDLDHVGELLVHVAPRSATPTSLLNQFLELAAGSKGGDAEMDVAARRVESDAQAVQIMTVFTAKGLEFPVVCLPTIWSHRGEVSKPYVWWDHKLGKRLIDVVSDEEWEDGTTQAERMEATAWEEAGTSLRLLYVALTRAKHHAAVWWMPTDGGRRSGLARVLFARDANGDIDHDVFMSPKVDVPFGAEAVLALDPLLQRGGGVISAELLDAPSGPPRARDVEPDDRAGLLAVASFSDPPSRDHRRWSFTAITKNIDAGTAQRPSDNLPLGEGRAGDEPSQDEPSQTVEASLVDAVGSQSDSDEVCGALPLGSIAGGAGFGNLVHSVFEHVDFSAQDIKGEVRGAISDALVENPWYVDGDDLADGLIAVLDTPLGPLFGSKCLRELSRVDRLDELSFELTLARGGSVPAVADIGELVMDGLPGDDPLRGWAEQIASGAFDGRLAGHLTGSIDLLARVSSECGPDRFVVCDYKTNRLGPPNRPAIHADYEPEMLAEEMVEHHYPLQALLYSVVTHRYLRWRVREYDPAVHLGGVGYLFVRGMTGPGTPTRGGVPTGLFEWHPPASLIVDLSDLLDGCDPARTGAA